jgi:cyclic nucleotide gated channel alpha 3
MKNGELCKSLDEIGQLYIRSKSSKIDLLSIIPTDFLTLALPNIYQRFLPALRLNRLLKVFRFKEFLSISETQTKFPNVFRMFSLIMNILLLIHWNACIYFLISYIIGFGSDNWVYPQLTTENDMVNQTATQIGNQLWTHELSTQYFFCLWWSTLTLTTIAEVNMPENYYEEIYMSILLMIGVIILATVIGSTRNMFTNATLQRESLQSKCDSVKEFLKIHKIDDLFGSRVQTYFDYLWSSPNLDQQDNVLECLPNKLCDEIAMNIHMDTLKRVAIFQDCEPGLLRELVSKLKLKLFSPGDYVCRKGDIGREMYFIKMGKLEVISDDGKQIFATLNAGAAFGEISILDIPGNKNGNKRTANIRSVGFTDLFQLTKDDLWSVLLEYPLAKQVLLEKGKLLLRKDNLIDEDEAVKVERRSEPVYIQVEYYEELLSKFNSRLDDGIKVYVDFLNKTKQKLTYLEKKYKNK